MRLISLALDMLRRDWRSGELTLPAVALLIAVASLTSVGFFADRVQQSLKRDATQLLGGDLLVSSDASLPSAWQTEASRRGLRVVNTINFSSMLSTGDAAQLSAAKFVEPGYPLRGSMRIAQRMGEVGTEAGRVPAHGEVWIEERLLSALQVKIGDQVNLGNSTFRVGAVITFESDRGSNFISFIPRVMVNAADLAATGLIQEGSRVRYRLQVAGERKIVDAFEQWLKPLLVAGQQLETIDNARPEIRANLTRIQHFLQLAALLAVVLAGVAIGLSARRYLQRHLDGCAVMRCFGARQGQLMGMFLWEFGLFALAMGVLGCLAGYVLQAGIAMLAASLISIDLPPPGWLPLLQGLLVSLVLVIGFITPQLLHLTRVPPVHVIRREWGAMQGGVLGVWLAGGLALFGLCLWVAGDIKLGSWVALGFCVACCVFAILARLALSALASLRHADASGSWGLRYGLAAMYRRRGASIVQCLALGLGLMALLLLAIVSGDLMQGWQKTLRPDAPNQFVLGIQPDQREPLAEFFRHEGLADVTLLPMIRGRLVELRGKPVRPDDYAEERARNLADREFNLSWASELPESNRVISGDWHGNRRVPEFSMEEGLGKTLGIELGDEVVFEVGGQRVRGTVGSVRKLDWDSMRVNFFFIAAPGLLDGLSTSWITSFRLPPGKQGTINAMLAQFPNLTVIDVGTMIAQVQDLSAKLIQVVQSVFGFALLAGLVVMWAALRATHDERIHEISVLRTLGARHAQLRVAMLAEFAVLGVLAGVLAIVGALATGYVLAIKVFEIQYSPDWSALLLCLLCVVAGVVLMGWLGVRGLLARTVIDGLRT